MVHLREEMDDEDVKVLTIGVAGENLVRYACVTSEWSRNAGRTGIGAVINTAKVEIGSTGIVFGLGGIGLNVIQGLRLAGADQIVGVDLNDGKEEMGRHFGMTDFVNPSNVDGDLVAHLVELTGGGADYSFDATGNVNVMRTALECAHKGWGESIIIGVAPADAPRVAIASVVVSSPKWWSSASQIAARVTSS